jgi:phage gp46-like protein
MNPNQDKLRLNDAALSVSSLKLLTRRVFKKWNNLFLVTSKLQFVKRQKQFDKLKDNKKTYAKTHIQFEMLNNK